MSGCMEDWRMHRKMTLYNPWFSPSVHLVLIFLWNKWHDLVIEMGWGFFEKILLCKMDKCFVWICLSREN